MLDIFKIYVDRLSEGKIEEIEGTVAPDFLEVSEKDLSFPDPIHIKGGAYVAETHLVLHLSVETTYKVPCKICNEMLTLPLVLEGLYMTEEIKTLKGKVFDFKESLRDAILIEIPLYSECDGDCPSRKELEMYFNKEK